MATKYGLQIPNNQQRMGIANQFDLPLDYSPLDLDARAKRAMTQPGWDIEMETFDPNVPQELQFWDGQPFTATPTDPYKVAGYDPYKGNTLTEDIDINSLRDSFAPFQNEMVGPNPHDPSVYDRYGNIQMALEDQDFYEEPQGLASIINSQLRNAKTNVGQKVGQGWDFAKQLPGMAMGALSGLSGIGALTGMFKESPEQREMMELYNSEDYQNVLNQIPGMANYNPVYGMGSGYGLTNAINKRLATLAKTRKKQGDDFSATLRKREEDLKKLLDLEKAKNIGGKTTTYTPTGNYGKDPGQTGSWTPGGTYQKSSNAWSGGGNWGPGGKSPSSKGSSSRGHHSRAKGGRVGYANGGLATLFTRRG